MTQVWGQWREEPPDQPEQYPSREEHYSFLDRCEETLARGGEIPFFCFQSRSPRVLDIQDLMNEPAVIAALDELIARRASLTEFYAALDLSASALVKKYEDGILELEFAPEPGRIHCSR